MLQEVLQIIFTSTYFFFKWLIKILSFKTFSKQTFSCLSYTCIFLILSYEYFTCKNLIKIFMFSCCWYIWGEWTKRLSINKIPVLKLCQLDLNINDLSVFWKYQVLWCHSAKERVIQLTLCFNAVRFKVASSHFLHYKCI